MSSFQERTDKGAMKSVPSVLAPIHTDIHLHLVRMPMALAAKELTRTRNTLPQSIAVKARSAPPVACLS